MRSAPMENVGEESPRTRVSKPEFGSQSAARRARVWPKDFVRRGLVLDEDSRKRETSGFMLTVQRPILTICQLVGSSR